MSTEYDKKDKNPTPAEPESAPETSTEETTDEGPTAPAPAGPRRDIWDRLMHLPLLRIFEPFYRAHKEVLLYLFFGVVTTLVSWGLFWLFDYGLRMHELVANALSWILTVFVAFLTNRVWVFDSPTRTVGAFLLQMLRFYFGRVATLVIEEGLLYVFITRLGWPDMWVKIAASVVVVVLNYVFSKWLIFRKRKAPRPDDQGTA